MDQAQFSGYALQPRINLRRALTISSRIVSRSEEKCRNTADSNTCEKPVGDAAMKLPIILGIVIPLVGAAVVIFYLHRRNVRRQRQEDAKDPTRHLDFGMDDGPGKKRKSMLFGAEKPHHKPAQLSMDMNLSSPYLLPPGIHQSHDSLHSLARGGEQDPYRHVAHYNQSETGSIRSFGARDPSLYNKRASVITGKSIGTVKTKPRTNSGPKEPSSPTGNPFNGPESSYPPSAATSVDVGDRARAHAQPQPPRSDELFMGSNIQQPPAALSKEIQDRPISRPASVLSDRAQVSRNIQPHEDGVTGLGLDFGFPKPGSPPVVVAPPQDSRRSSSPERGYDDGKSNPQIQTSYYEDYDDFDRGRSTERQSRIEVPGLTVPSQNNKRLSVGFRPLPPDEVTETDDPETRANRIRSFYKEYFDETADVPLPPAPPGGHQQYYEDYDAGYLGEAAYYDADSNAFVMPYAQPVTRRAMTPPPGGRRGLGGPGGPGPRGPPRGPHGSIGGMNLGPRPRAGSVGFGGPPSGYNSRAPSSLGPRPDSSASARAYRQPPKKKGPPPTALHTLPTPSKLKDDSFAIMGAIDFAPPDSFRDQAAGRSQSPLGERRPYHSPTVPISSPLVNAFEELPSVPSPHLLRKSMTFTNLDFAPPKKFRDPDAMSDAGSIRSNRSGMSAAGLSAVRGGAGRVSRLPGDTVFTQAALAEELKPQWGMRRY